jgi:hypothetical protein
LARRQGGDDVAYSSAQIVSLLSCALPEMASSFVKADAAEKLGLESDRELMLLTDALHSMAKRGLITWRREDSSWQNNSH